MMTNNSNINTGRIRIFEERDPVLPPF